MTTTENTAEHGTTPADAVYARIHGALETYYGHGMRNDAVDVQADARAVIADLVALGPRRRVILGTPSEWADADLVVDRTGRVLKDRAGTAPTVVVVDQDTRPAVEDPVVLPPLPDVVEHLRHVYARDFGFHQRAAQSAAMGDAQRVYDAIVAVRGKPGEQQ